MRLGIVASSFRALGVLVVLALIAAPAGAAGSSPAKPAEPKAAKPSKSACAGLANWEIVRSTGAKATCSAGNRVTGGSCTGIQNGGPSADGDGWECLAGEQATAICAAVCSAAPPARGACCTGSACSEVTFAACVAGGGTYQGDGTTCAGTSCVKRGACCVEDSRLCIDEVTEDECRAERGTYVGDGTHCDDDEAEICF